MRYSKEMMKIAEELELKKGYAVIQCVYNIDAHLEPAHSVIKNATPGQLYKIGNAPRDYYKSLNPYYNKV